MYLVISLIVVFAPVVESEEKNIIIRFGHHTSPSFVKYFFFLNLFFPCIFFCETLLLKKTFRWKTRIFFMVQGFFFGFWTIGTLGNLILLNTSSYCKDCSLSNYYNILFYCLHLILFPLWSLALSTPLNKLKFFNWPFETRAGYVEPKKWIPPRER